MRSIAVSAMLAISACTFTACAARSAPPQHPSANTATAVATACGPTAQAGRYREMTWNEYYARVKERAWRRGAMVVWLNPPRVRKAAPVSAHATACK